MVLGRCCLCGKPPEGEDDAHDGSFRSQNKDDYCKLVQPNPQGSCTDSARCRTPPPYPPQALCNIRKTKLVMNKRTCCLKAIKLFDTGIMNRFYSKQNSCGDFDSGKTTLVADPLLDPDWSYGYSDTSMSDQLGAMPTVTVKDRTMVY